MKKAGRLNAEACNNTKVLNEEIHRDRMLCRLHEMCRSREYDSSILFRDLVGTETLTEEASARVEQIVKSWSLSLREHA